VESYHRDTADGRLEKGNGMSLKEEEEREEFLEKIRLKQMKLGDYIEEGWEEKEIAFMQAEEKREKAKKKLRRAGNKLRSINRMNLGLGSTWGSMSAMSGPETIEEGEEDSEIDDTNKKRRPSKEERRRSKEERRRSKDARRRSKVEGILPRRGESRQKGLKAIMMPPWEEARIAKEKMQALEEEAKAAKAKVVKT